MLGAVSAADDNMTQEISASDVEVESQLDDVEIENDLAEDGGDLQDLEFYDGPDDEVLNDSYVYVSTSASPKAYGDIQVYLDEEYYSSTSANGGFYLDSSILSPAKHTLKLNFLGDKYYKPVNATYEFKVVSFKLSIPDELSDENHIDSYLPQDATGTIKIKVDGVQYDEDIDVSEGYEDGNYQVISSYLTGISYGSHAVEVIYSGDGKYASLSKKKTVNYVYMINIDCYDSFLYKSENNRLIVYLPDELESLPTIKIDGADAAFKWDEYSSGFYVETSNLGLGFHTLSVSYKDSSYPSRTVTKTFYVEAALVYDLQIDYNDGNISLVLPEDATGSLALSYRTEDSDDYTLYKNVPLVDGKADIQVKNLNVGAYIFKLEYDGNYESFVESQVYRVEIMPAISVPDRMVAGENYNIAMTANSDFNGNAVVEYVTIDEDDDFADWEYDAKELGNVNIRNGFGTLPLSLPVGKYEIRVTVEGMEKKFDVSVRKNTPDSIYLEANIKKEYFKFYTGDGPYVSASLPSDADGDLKIYIDGKYGWTLDYPQEEFEFNGYGLDVGPHTIEFRYSGDSFYNDINRTYNFDVVNILIYIPEELIVNYDEQVYAELPYDATGTLSVYMDGKLVDRFTKNQFSEYESEGGYTLTSLLSPSIDPHTIEVTYRGDSKYGDVTRKMTVNTTYMIDLYIDGGYYYGYSYNDGNTWISFSLPSDAELKPNVTIDGIAFDKFVIDEEANYYELDIAGLPIGDHALVVSYQDNKYPFKSINGTFSIIPKIIVENPHMFSGEDCDVELKLPENATGYLSVQLYDEYYGNLLDEYRADMKNGSATIKISNLKIGEYYMTYSYVGDDYEVESDYTYLSVSMDIQYPYSMTYGEDKYLTIKSDETDNSKITVYVDGKVYGEITLVNGQGKLSLSKLPIGEDVTLGIYRDSDFVDERFIEVLPRPCKLTGAKDITMYYNSGKTYSVKVYGITGEVVGKGEIVKIKIGSSTYKVKTNAKGIASLKIPTVPGKYKITASYGDVKVTTKLVVKQVLKLKTVKVKKSAKKLVLTATLKQGSKALKSKVIVFKFNGKTYKVKTNKKGVAKVKIKKSVLKKLKPGKKVTYKATYLKDTVKKTVKVKK